MRASLPARFFVALAPAPAPALAHADLRISELEVFLSDHEVAVPTRELRGGENTIERVR